MRANFAGPALGLLILLASHAALADDTFEAKASGAQRVRQLDDVVWALTAPCDAGDDVQQRQCRTLRDERAASLTGATLVVDADAAAFAVGAWNPQKKSTPLALAGCIRCAAGGLTVDGKPWFVTASVPRVEGGTVRAAPLYDSAKLFADAAAAAAWAKSVATVRVELLARVPAKRRWQAGGHDGFLLDVVGYRVISVCDGSIVIANPPSSPVAADPKACAAAGPKPAAAR